MSEWECFHFVNHRLFGQPFNVFLIQLQPSKTYIQIMLRPIRWNPRMVGIRLFSITRLNFNTNNNTRASPSSSSLFAYIHDYNTLLEKVKSTITSNSSESDILEAMNGIKIYRIIILFKIKLMILQN